MGPPGQRLRAVGGGGGGAEHPLADYRRHRRGALRQGRANPDDHFRSRFTDIRMRGEVIHKFLGSDSRLPESIPRFRATHQDRTC